MASVTSNPSTAGTLANRAQGLLTIRIEPPRKWFELRLKELWTYRELLYFLVWRDVKVRYEQTAIGVCTFHQNHDYGYHPEEEKGVWEGGEALENYPLLERHRRFRTLDNATHLWFHFLDWTRPLRRRIGGSEAVEHFDHQGHQVIGVDNNMRRVFFSDPGDTTWNLERLRGVTRNLTHFNLDIRDRSALEELFRKHKFDLIVHCAAQPPHGMDREIPILDFEVNALGTVYLLEATRLHCPDAVFVFLSTNKVYGDAPNVLPLKELETRWEYARPEDFNGIDEHCRLDRTLHSLFGASKASADLMAQEYGRYFGMKVGVFRGGCLTGPSHSGVELHCFLSYLAKVALSGGTYTVYGYKGKQIRDNIHSHYVVRAIKEFAANPWPGEVYNLGGGRENSICGSIKE